jgi:hypothetical protein
VQRWIALTFLVASAGCGRSGVPVEGSVSLAGASVDNGTIAFEPADGKGPVVGGAIHDGKYRVPKEAGMLPGKKLARITAIYKTGRQVARGTGAAPGAMAEELKTILPAPAPCEIQPGPPNRLDFDLPQ